MSLVLTLELGDRDYADLRHQAEMSGVTIADLIIFSLKHYKSINKSISNVKLQTKADGDLARQRFRRHAGSIQSRT